MQIVTIIDIKTNNVVFEENTKQYLLNRRELRQDIQSRLSINQDAVAKIFQGTSNKYTLTVTEPKDNFKLKKIDFSLTDYNVGDREYYASIDGRIFNKKSNGVFFELKQSENKVHGQPYLQVGISSEIENKTAAFPVHRLVALAWIERVNKDDQVDHIDCNRQNNHVSNLRWVTQEFNRSRIEYTSRKPVSCYSKDGEFIMSFDSVNKAAKHFNIHYQGILSVISGKNKTCNKMYWKAS